MECSVISPGIKHYSGLLTQQYEALRDSLLERLDEAILQKYSCDCSEFPRGCHTARIAIERQDSNLLIIETRSGLFRGALSFDMLPEERFIGINFIGVIVPYHKYGRKLMIAVSGIALKNSYGITLEAETEESATYFRDKIGMHKIDSFEYRFTPAENAIFYSQEMQQRTG